MCDSNLYLAGFLNHRISSKKMIDPGVKAQPSLTDTFQWRVIITNIAIVAIRGTKR